MTSSAAAFLGAALALACAGESAGAQGSNARAAALSPFAREKARLLVRDKLSCLGCHRIGSEGGIIGPDLSRGGGARTPEFVLRMMRTPSAVAPGGIMPAVEMRDDVMLLVARYVSSLTETPSADARVIPQAAASADRYARLCASCHGATGHGDGPNAAFLPVPPARHASSTEMSKRTDDRLYDAIAAGGSPLGRSPRMPAFRALLSDAEIRELVRHIRALCKCEGPVWSRQ